MYFFVHLFSNNSIYTEWESSDDEQPEMGEDAGVDTMEVKEEKVQDVDSKEAEKSKEPLKERCRELNEMISELSVHSLIILLRFYLYRIGKFL